MLGRGHNVQIYLSPHLDDVALSCGGRVWQQAQGGTFVRVITVFAGAPDPDQRLSPFAQELHARWGTPVDAVRTRRTEDSEALGILGAQAVHWRFQDCVYRRSAQGHFPYPDEEALWGPIDPADGSLVRQLRDRIGGLCLGSSGHLYVPLAVGGHVDHRIVRRAAEQSGARLTYYEDFPYAEDAESVTTAIGNRAWNPEVVTLSEEALRTKVAALARYRSQVSTFWQGSEEMAASVRGYAERLGGEAPAERYWRVRPA